MSTYDETLKECRNACTKLMIMWSFREYNNMDDMYYDGSSEYSNESLIAKVLRNKMKDFDIPIKIPDELLMIIEICSGANPGISQMMLREIIGNNRERDTVLTSVDFSNVFKYEFPIAVKGSKWEKHFMDAWDKQKDKNYDNLCDTPEYWRELFI